MAIDPETKKGRRALERLRSDRIGWLTTVTPDGQPQSLPIWFLWDGSEILIYSHREAVRNRNIAANRLVAFHFSDDGSGSDIVSIEGEARIDDGHPQGRDNPAYLAKYAQMLAEMDLSPDEFSRDYDVPILIRPSTVRGAA